MNSYKNVLRKASPLGKCLLKSTQKRHQCNLTTLEIDGKTGVATLSMNNSPVNALNERFLKAISSDLRIAEKSKARGLILTSSLKNVFSAGMDLNQLCTGEEDRIRGLWSSVHDVVLNLRSHTLPTVALINGHAIGGGCVLGLCCEYRVMLPSFKIGLNEVVLGIVPPAWALTLYSEAIPRRTAALALTQGKLYLAQEASKIGLVNEIVNNYGEGVVRSELFFDNFKNVAVTTRAITKKQNLYKILEDRKGDLDSFVKQAKQPHVQAAMAAIIEGLKNK